MPLFISDTYTDVAFPRKARLSGACSLNHPVYLSRPHAYAADIFPKVDADTYIGRARNLLHRVVGGGTLGSAAEAAGIPPGSATKARWLAKVYTPEVCGEVGVDTLERLSPSHLEVVAKLPADRRRELLQLAAKEQLSVRSLKLAAQAAREDSASDITVLGGESQFRTVASALGTYLGWSDESLDRLLKGGSGEFILQVAEQGARLLRRVSPDQLPNKMRRSAAE